jgi:hypothetical protein
VRTGCRPTGRADHRGTVKLRELHGEHAHAAGGTAEVGHGSAQRAAVDAVAHGKARDAAAGLVDDAGEVGSEAGRRLPAGNSLLAVSRRCW